MKSYVVMIDQNNRAHIAQVVKTNDPMPVPRLTGVKVDNSPGYAAELAVLINADKVTLERVDGAA